MHILPLPFGMAVVLLPRPHAQLARPNRARQRQTPAYVRDLTGPEGRYAELRQLLR